MRPLLTLALITCGVLSAGVANADSFTTLPDGTVVFNTVLSSRGTFTCLGTIPCTGSGTSTITIGSGARTSTISFTGVTNSSFGVRNISKLVSIGMFEAETSDGFVFPLRPNPRQPIVGFQLSMTHTSPTNTTRRKGMTFRGGGLNLPVLTSGGSSIQFPTGPQPPGAHYTSIIYSFNPFPVVIGRNGTTNLTAKVGAVPEPSTLILLGSGLAYGAYARRKKRAASQS